MNIFLVCAVILLVALAASKLLGQIKIPAVTSYLLLGIIIGPYCLKLIPQPLVDSADLVGYFVLGIVAFSLGENFLWAQFKTIGKEVIVISIGEVIGAFVLVGAGLLLIKQPLYVALLFAGIAPASAPMAIYMVVRELRARGKFTQTLLSILAIDDMWGIILFAVMVAVAKFLTHIIATSHPFVFALAVALKEIFGAILIGLVLGFLLAFLSRYIKAQMELLIYTLGFILATIGISLYIEVSPLLASMSLGAVALNLTKSHRFFTVLRRIDWVFYLLFFVLAGASFEIQLLQKLSLIGGVYIIARAAGLYFGANISGKCAHSEPKIRKYVGLGLFAQAGVALGLAVIARVEFPEVGNIIFSAVVATTIIFEIIGPLSCRFALNKAGETNKI